MLSDLVDLCGLEQDDKAAGDHNDTVLSDIFWIYFVVLFLYLCFVQLT